MELTGAHGYIRVFVVYEHGIAPYVRNERKGFTIKYQTLEEAENDVESTDPEWLHQVEDTLNMIYNLPGVTIKNSGIIKRPQTTRPPGDNIVALTGAPVKTDWSHKTDPLQTKPYNRPKFLDVPKDADVYQKHDAYIAATEAYYYALDDAHRSVVLAYTGYTFKRINKSLRSDEPTQEAKEFEKTFNEVIDGAPPLPYDLIVYRGAIDFRHSFVEKGFMSTSTSYYEADKFGYETFAITLEKGSHVFYQGAFHGVHGEEEVILRSGLSLELIGEVKRPTFDPFWN